MQQSAVGSRDTRWSWIAYARHLRWACVPVILIGYALTAEYFAPPLRHQYLLLTGVSVVSCALFMVALRGRIRDTFPQWTVFVVIFIGHYVQSYWLILNAAEVAVVDAVLASGLSDELMLGAFRQATYAFGAAAMTALVISARVRAPIRAPARSLSGARSARIAKTAIVLALALVVITTFLMITYGIGIVGVDTNLPYRSAGIVQSVRQVCVPVLLLSVIVVTEGVARNRVYRVVALALMVSVALLDLLITTSRSVLLLVALRLFVLYVVQDQISAKRVRALGAAVIMTAVLFPFVSMLRESRSAGVGASEAVASMRQEDALQLQRAPMLASLAARFAGVNALLPIMQAEREVGVGGALLGFAGGPSISEFATRAVFGYEAGDKMGIAPSMLGWLYLAGGENGQIVGAGLVLAVLSMMWHVISATHMRMRPVLQAVAGVSLFFHVAEGTFEALWVPLGVASLSCWAVEWLLVGTSADGQVRRHGKASTSTA